MFPITDRDGRTGDWRRLETDRRDRLEEIRPSIQLLRDLHFERPEAPFKEWWKARDWLDGHRPEPKPLPDGLLQQMGELTHAISQAGRIPGVDATVPTIHVFSDDSRSAVETLPYAGSSNELHPTIGDIGNLHISPGEWRVELHAHAPADRRGPDPRGIAWLATFEGLAVAMRKMADLSGFTEPDLWLYFFTGIEPPLRLVRYVTSAGPRERAKGKLPDGSKMWKRRAVEITIRSAGVERDFFTRRVFKEVRWRLREDHPETGTPVGNPSGPPPVRPGQDRDRPRPIDPGELIAEVVDAIPEPKWGGKGKRWEKVLAECARRGIVGKDGTPYTTEKGLRGAYNRYRYERKRAGPALEDLTDPEW